MLQQTSVARVRTPWGQFLAAFPTPRACAAAPRAAVLRSWRDLGYPRRAVALHRAAEIIVAQHRGRVPSDLDALLALPGVGPYTARAVRVFAFGRPDGVVDVNVRRVLTRFVANADLSATEAQSLANRLVDPAAPAVFTQAVLDLGAQFCRSTPRCDVCPVRRHCSWVRLGGDDPGARSRLQPPYEGSRREARGRLLSRLRDAPVSRRTSLAALDPDPEVAARMLQDLEREGLVRVRRGRVELGSS